MYGRHKLSYAQTYSLAYALQSSDTLMYINIYKIVLIFELIPGTLGKLFETIEFPGMNELQIFGAECGFNGKFSL